MSTPTKQPRPHFSTAFSPPGSRFRLLWMATITCNEWFEVCLNGFPGGSQQSEHGPLNPIVLGPKWLHILEDPFCRSLPCQNLDNG